MFTDAFSGGFGGAFPAEVTFFISTAVLVAIIAILFAGRRDDDRTGSRPIARYLAAIGILTLFVTLFATFGAVQSLTDLVVDHEKRFDEYTAYYESQDFNFAEGSEVFLPVAYTLYDFSSDPTNDSNYSAAVASGLVAFTTGAVFALHARFRRRLMAGKHAQSESTARVDRTYHAGRCFVAALVVPVALTSVGFGLFEIIAPGISVGGEADVVRAEGISEMLSFGVLAVASALIFVRSWRRLSPDLGLAS